MILAFSSIADGLVSFFSSSQVIQNIRFSSLYSDRKNSRKTPLPSGEHIIISKLRDQAITSSSVGCLQMRDDGNSRNYPYKITSLQLSVNKLYVNGIKRHLIWNEIAPKRTLKKLCEIFQMISLIVRGLTRLQFHFKEIWRGMNTSFNKKSFKQLVPEQ